MKEIFQIVLVQLVLLVALLPQSAAAQDPPAALAGVEGIILKAGTGEPLSKATVELSGGPQPQVTTTENDGRFYFPNLAPGTYRLRSTRDGHWTADYGQRWVGGPGQPITLAAGQRMTNVQLIMTPGAVISGRITNRFGQPLVGARVRAMKPWIQENQRSLRVMQEVVTNDLGEYRLIWLLPGRYYVSATYVDFQGGAQLVINPDANTPANPSRSVPRQVTATPLFTGLAPDEVYSPIYYPATSDAVEAVAIDLKMGAENRGVDISVGPTRTFHVRGVVTNPPPPQVPQAGQPGLTGQPPRPIPPMPVRLAPLNPNGSLYNTPVDAESGRFDFPKVVPGGYVSYLFINGLTVRAPVEVRAGDVDGIFLTIGEGVSIPVSVSFDGEPPPKMPNPSNLRPTLWRNPTIINAPSMPATMGGTLALQNIAPGDYHVYMPPLLAPLSGAYPVIQPPLWQNAYVKSMRLGNVDVLKDGLRFSGQPEGTLEVVVGGNPGTLEGRVLNDRLEPAVSVTVTLFAAEAGSRIYRTDMYKATATDTAGRFRVEGLPPGEYKVFAWEGIENGAWMDTNFLRAYENWGQPARVEEGKSTSVNVPVVVMR
jgi:hypothetical protein